MLIKVSSPGFVVAAVSNSLLSALALKREVVIDKYFSDIFLTNNNAVTVLSNSFLQACKTKQLTTVAAYPLNINSPNVTYWSATNLPVINDEGLVEYIVHTPVNITGQMRLKQTQMSDKLNIQLQQDSLNELFMKAPVGVAFLNKDNFIIEYANKAICEMWNRTLPDEILGKPALDIVIETDGLRIVLDKVLRTGKPFLSDDTPVLLANRERPGTSYFDLMFEPLRGADEEVTGIIAIAVDVTEKVEARLMLEDAEQRLRLATESTGLGTWDLDLRNSDIIYSPRLAEIFGIPPGRLLTHNQLRSAVHPNDIGMVRKAFERALQTGKYFYEVRILWPDGTIRWIRTTGSVVYDAKHEPLRMLGTANDVTVQRELIDDLKASEENLRLATQAAELGTFDMDIVKHTLEWDKRCRELFGLFTSRPVNYDSDFLNTLHADDRDRISAVIAQSMDKKISNGDYDVEYRTIGLEDKKERWVKAKGKVFFDDNDRPTRFMGATLDITESKLNEIRKNDFIAMASHELKTPLTSLKAYIQLLLLKAGKGGDEFLIASLKKCDNQVSKMTSLIYGFLDLSKIEAGKLKLNPSEFEVNELINNVVAESVPISPSHIIDFSPSIVVNLIADREKISQVLVNFISNAVKYSPKQSKIYIGAEVIESVLKVFVKDEGIGVDKQHQQNIFQRFYRVENAETKGTSGFGIGLYLSAEIIQLHGGNIGVNSEPGKGSTFYFTLPLSSS